MKNKFILLSETPSDKTIAVNISNIMLMESHGETGTKLTLSSLRYGHDNRSNSIDVKESFEAVMSLIEESDHQ